MENYHIILVRHAALTDSSMIARVRIKSERFEQTIRIPYTNLPNEVDNPVIEAKKYLESKGFDIIGQGELKNDYVLISSTFKPLK